MTYIALRRLKVGDEIRYHGDPIPEARDWKPSTRHFYESAGAIRRATPDEMAAAEAQASARNPKAQMPEPAKKTQVKPKGADAKTGNR